MKNDSTLKGLFSTMWALIKKFGLTRSQALKKAWENLRFKRLLHSGVVHFFYKKKDGTYREARGTLKGGLVPPTKGEGRGCSYTQTYFDTDENAYRCFQIQNFLNVVE